MKDFESVKNQIGFCGIWCGSCIVGNGALQELSRRYREMIERYGVEEWGPDDFNFAEFKKGMKSIQAISLCKGCLRGDGNEDCEIRPCALNRGVSDCVECDEFGQSDKCRNSKSLHKIRKGVLDADLLVKTDRINKEKLIENWTAELKSKFPGCVLFHDD
jgi:hypothetical protein